MIIFSLIFSLFDELESQRRFLLDESVQSAFLKKFGIKVQPGEGRAASGQQHGEQRQTQPANQGSSSDGSSAPSDGQQRSDPADLARGKQKEPHDGVLPSRIS